MFIVSKIKFNTMSITMGNLATWGKKAVNEEKCVCLQSDVVMFLFFKLKRMNYQLSKQRAFFFFCTWLLLFQSANLKNIIISKLLPKSPTIVVSGTSEVTTFLYFIGTNYLTHLALLLMNN